MISLLILCDCRAKEESSRRNVSSPSLDSSRCTLVDSPEVSVFFDETRDVTVITPVAHHVDQPTLLGHWLKENRSKIRNCIFTKGGILLRNWSIINVTVAERAIFQDIGLSPMEPYPDLFLDFNMRAKALGVAPNGLTQEKLSRNAPDAQKLNMQAPHVEFGLGPIRPRVVGFFVEIAPEEDGTTARVYFPDAVKLLSEELYNLLHENGWHQPQAGVVQPSVMIHPETGLETLQLYSFSNRLARVALKAYQEVRKTTRPDLPEVLQVQIAETKSNTVDYTLELCRPNGTFFELPPPLQLEYYRALFTTIRLQDWRKGDLLLFDNMLYGHMRMPGKQPRRLHAMFAEEVDSRTFKPKNAPRIVEEGATKKAPTSIQVILQELGPGGNMWVLWILSLLPDVLFQCIGQMFWANGGVSGAVRVLWHFLWGNINEGIDDEL